MSNVFAFTETRLGALRRAGLEAVTAARQVADRPSHASSVSSDPSTGRTRSPERVSPETLSRLADHSTTPPARSRTPYGLSSTG